MAAPRAWRDQLMGTVGIEGRLRDSRPVVTDAIQLASGRARRRNSSIVSSEPSLPRLPQPNRPNSAIVYRWRARGLAEPGFRHWRARLRPASADRFKGASLDLLWSLLGSPTEVSTNIQSVSPALFLGDGFRNSGPARKGEPSAVEIWPFADRTIAPRQRAESAERSSVTPRGRDVDESEGAVAGRAAMARAWFRPVAGQKPVIRSGSRSHHFSPAKSCEAPSCFARRGCQAPVATSFRPNKCPARRSARSGCCRKHGPSLPDRIAC